MVRKTPARANLLGPAQVSGRESILGLGLPTAGLQVCPFASACAPSFQFEECSKMLECPRPSLAGATEMLSEQGSVRGNEECGPRSKSEEDDAGKQDDPVKTRYHREQTDLHDVEPEQEHGHDGDDAV